MINYKTAMKYERPYITLISVGAEFMQYSEMGPGATDIGAPTLESSVWDEEETHYNNTKE